MKNGVVLFDLAEQVQLLASAKIGYSSNKNGIACFGRLFKDSSKKEAPEEPPLLLTSSDDIRTFIWNGKSYMDRISG